MVMDGLRRPSGLNNVSLFILAKGSLGFGSLGVPSTLAQRPTVLFQPTMALSMQQLSWVKAEDHKNWHSSNTN